ncbi:aryl-alcohol dehydrogenase-like predicted oxidoreductase [Krasilnikovia cinnamomea]|uniref:Aryl-alcohol dehydrogenase-like predicted oxidoreductase n=1 Tax=Krasilnikovia cinnamomea TaxID=349313 RepID=A0A4Q7ZJY7_9ACTN|nr:aldo/keto reductase [Krasilnikovia cinnamomea]RZU51220.1 aryl-alcohol dehydrogenase-like predicted oxidoreductase [Krasilnikovia cinnamomea]
MTTAPATADTLTIGGALPVRRLGYGTMQLTGPGHWDLPADPAAAVTVLRTAVHGLGINHLDTADAYGPHTVESLIREALHPYPDSLVIASKGGLTRPGPNIWRPCGRPEYLTQSAELSLRRLGLDCLDLYYLHRVDANVPLADQLGALVELRQAGKIRHIGLSKVTVDQVEQARTITDIAAVQNQHGLTTTDPVLDYCERNGLAYVAHKPFDAGADLARTGAGAADTPAPGTILRTLLQRSPVMLVIPGTASLEHLRSNCTVDARTTSNGATTIVMPEIPGR